MKRNLLLAAVATALAGASLQADTVVLTNGDKLTVTLNGEVVVNEAQLPGVAAKGKIALQHHGSFIDFANIWIKEL